jgi:tetratricopeptide (TPR) repeat protein
MWQQVNPNINSAGIGWHIEPFDGKKMVYHDGGDPGYRTEFRMIPHLSLAVIIMRNCWEPPLTEIASCALRAAVGKDLKYQKENQNQILMMGQIWRSLRKNGVDSTIELYRKLRKKKNEKCFHPSQLNRIGTYLSWLGRNEDACALYKLNVNTYPKIFQLYNILANAYLELGKKELAIEFYEKSVKIKPENNNAAEMLKSLRSQK